MILLWVCNAMSRTLPRIWGLAEQDCIGAFTRPFPARTYSTLEEGDTREKFIRHNVKPRFRHH